VRAYLAKHPEIVTEKFPAYAPELNPDEQVWNNTKYGSMANFAAPNTAALRLRLHKEISRLRKRKKVLASFIRHAELQLLL